MTGYMRGNGINVLRIAPYSAVQVRAQVSHAEWPCWSVRDSPHSRPPVLLLRAVQGHAQERRRLDRHASTVVGWLPGRDLQRREHLSWVAARSLACDLPGSLEGVRALSRM